MNSKLDNTCILPPALPVNPSTEQKIAHLQATHVYMECVFKSMRQHAQTVAEIIAKHHAAYDFPPVSNSLLPFMAREILQDCMALQDAELQNFRAKLRSYVVETGDADDAA